MLDTRNNKFKDFSRGTKFNTSQQQSTFDLLLLTLAKASEAAPEDTRFRIGFTNSLALLSLGSAQYRVLVYPENIKLGGNISYRGFMLDTLLYPSRADLTLRLWKKNETKPRSKLYPDQSFYSVLANGFRADFEDSTTWSGGRADLEFSNFSFQPDKPAKLSARFQRIDAYLDARAVLAERWLVLISPEKKSQDPDSIIARSDMLRLWKTWFAGIEDIDYANEAGCTYQESKEFKAQKYEFRIALERAEIEAQNRILDLDGALVERATRLLRFAKRDQALRYIDKALEINPRNEQALAKKLQIFNEQKRFQESVRLLARNPGLFKAHQFQRPLEKASRGLEEKIIQTVRRGEKDEAATMVASMDSLCKAFPGLRCPDFGYPQASGQERAIYQQRLNAARSLVSINSLEQAETMALQALQYAQDENLPRANITTCTNLIDQIRQRIIDVNSYKAKDNFYRGNDSLAIANLQTVKNYLALNSNYKAPIYQSVVNKTLKNYIIKQLSELGEDEKSAANIKAKMYDLALGFNLETDREIAQNFVKIANANKLPACQSATKNYMAMVAEGRKKSQDKKFIQAELTLVSAIGLAKENKGCLLPLSLARRIIDSIRYPVHYQKELLRIQTFIADDKPDSAYIIHKKADLYFAENALSNTLPRQSIADLFSHEKNASFGIYVANIALQKGYLDSSLHIVLAIQKHKKPRYQWKRLQEDLGFALAKRDRELDPKSDPKAKAAAYTDGIKSLKLLAEQYTASRDEL